MKLTKSFAICVIAAAVCLFALAGCEGAGGGNTGNNGYEGDGYVNGEDTSGVLEAGLVIATAPNDFVGDFYFDGEVACTNVNTCEFEATGVVEIEFTSKDKLFLTKYAKANPDEDQEVNWDIPGDWGLAPQGLYFDEKDKIEGLTKTWIEDGQILLEWKGTILGAIVGDKFTWESEGGSKYTGSVSTDLKTITYHVIKGGGNESDEVLIRVE
ncbi:MAG: hypothetical protein WC654_06525 [Patescibacteria group bacterium]